MKNLLISILESLNVKHTKDYSNKLFREHPHKYNLYGLSKMLEEYRIDNVGLKINNKQESIHDIETPFIAQVSDDFQLVRKIDSEYVETLWKGTSLRTPLEEFLKIWSGIILAIESDELSSEPNYANNRKKEIFGLVQKNFLFLLLTVVIAVPFITQHIYTNIALSLLLLLNLIGVFVCALLVQKQLNTRSEYADKICSLFSQGDCNNVLESDAAKFLGIIGWSEAGLGYFISNAILVLFFPHLISFLAVINICALPYSFWSIWYQKVIAKQWCTLCLVVQILFWTIFIVDIFANYVYVPYFSLLNIVQVCCIYFIPFLVLNILVPLLSEQNKMEQIKQEINSLKANEDVFSAILMKQPYYDININSQIVWGNPDSGIHMTVLTNPHCVPCAKMHERIKKVLKQNEHLNVSYIFSSFDNKLDSSNQFLIAAYLQNKDDVIGEIYDEWFKKGKNEKESFFEKFHFDPNNISPDVEQEFLKHERWKDATRLRETPTILINGYKLPQNFAIEDIRLITKLSV